MKRNKSDESQELEESWDWNNPRNKNPQKIVGGGAFLSEEDESSKSKSPPKTVPKRKVLNGFMLSDEDQSLSPEKPSNLNVFLSNDESNSPKSTKKTANPKYPGFGLISSESEEKEPRETISIYSKESSKDSMDDIFTGNKISEKLKAVQQDSVFKSKIEVNPEPKSIENSEQSLQNSKDPFSLEFGKAHTLLESQITEIKQKFKPEETPSLYDQAKMFKKKILNSEGKQTLKAKLEKIKMEVKALDSIANINVKLSLAEDITAQLIEIFILESKSEGGPSGLNLQGYSKQILNEMRFGLPSLDKRLESKAFANLLEEKFLFGEQQKYRLAFGTRFSQKKQIKLIIQNFFRINHIQYYFNKKDINRPVKVKPKLNGTFVESLIRRDLQRARAKGNNFFGDYILRNLGIDSKLKTFKSSKQKNDYIHKLLISKIQALKDPSKKILKIVLDVFKSEIKNKK